MPVEVITGKSPLIISLPHTGTNMQPVTTARLLDAGQAIAEPDHYLDRLFGGLSVEASVLRCNFHRFVSDVDHPAPRKSDQPRRGMIGVVPLIDAMGHSIWSVPPSRAEADSWRSSYFVPYHAALAAQIARTRAKQGHAVLLTCRAVKNKTPHGQKDVPWDINISSYRGASCALDLSSKLVRLCTTTEPYRTVLNGRNTAGWITAHYGRPRALVHALDLEIHERLYLNDDEPPGQYDAERAAPLLDLLRDALSFVAAWKPP